MASPTARLVWLLSKIAWLTCSSPVGGLQRDLVIGVELSLHEPCHLGAALDRLGHPYQGRVRTVGVIALMAGKALEHLEEVLLSGRGLVEGRDGLGNARDGFGDPILCIAALGDGSLDAGHGRQPDCRE